MCHLINCASVCKDAWLVSVVTESFKINGSASLLYAILEKSGSIIFLNATLEFYFKEIISSEFMVRSNKVK